MRQVFISYSSKDLAQAQAVRNVLEQNGITCWMAPADIPGGSNYTKEIPIAIRGCQAFVLMLSDNAQKSHWVLKELDSAVNAGKIILPFQLEDVPLSDEFNFLLTGAQRYAAYQRKSEAMMNLVQRIKAIIGTGKQTENQPDNAQLSAEEEQKKRVVGEFVNQIFSHAGTSAGPTKIDLKTGVQRFLKCPACGGVDVTTFPDQVKPQTLLERILGVGFAAAMATFLPMVGGIIMFMLMDFLYYELDVNGDILDVMEGLLPILMIGLTVLGVIISGRLFATWLKRQRIRKHIKVTECCCKTCQKKFQAVEKE